MYVQAEKITVMKIRKYFSGELPSVCNILNWQRVKLIKGIFSAGFNYAVSIFRRGSIF